MLKMPRFDHATDSISKPSHASTTIQMNVPIGTQWQNNSCAYDAVITILFNIWHDNPDATSEDGVNFTVTC